MATYTEQTLEQDASHEDIKKLMIQKAHELFVLCDKEKKGFITKRDMQRLQGELHLGPEQLEAVFDSLDDDKNGYLTLEEFTEGFGSYLGLAPPGLEHQASVDSTASSGTERVYENEHLNSEDEEETFNDLVDNIGARDLFEDLGVLRQLWGRLRREEPELLGNFEEFLNRTSTELKRTHQDYQTLESILRSKTVNHDEEVRKLYEEMENQIKLEKDRITAEERAKERQLREALEREMIEKDKQLQELLQKHQEMESKLQGLNHQEVETKQENELLLKEKLNLEESLDESQRNLEDSKSYISQLRQKHRDEKKDRAMAALQISEGIALERESLVKQLDMLRDMNRRLRDDRDEVELRRDTSVQQELSELEILNGARIYKDDTCDSEAATDEPISGSLRRSTSSTSTKSGSGSTKKRQSGVPRQGSVMSDYLQSPGRSPKNKRKSDSFDPSFDIEEDDEGHFHGDDDLIECDEPVVEQRFSAVQAMQSFADSYQDDVDLADDRLSSPRHKHDSDSEVAAEEFDQQMAAQSRRRASSRMKKRPSYLERTSDDEAEQPGGGYVWPPAAARSVTLADELSMALGESDTVGPDRQNYVVVTDKSVGVEADFDVSLPRAQPVGANSTTETSVDILVEDASSAPGRIFKVVFVGDSGVGKSSFIHRFCNNEFRATFSATIGVDFQIKAIRVDGHHIALQLWDTAGQERFRSITKQYFRKADGVIIMYDVTSETSFKNVRNWMTSVQDGTEEGTILVLVGNKIDLVADEDHRSVRTKDGVRLADEYGALFYESSAKSGAFIKETLHGLASLLREKEDREIEKAVNLAEPEKKTGCCS